jgi:hypothetical protein
MRNPYSLEMLEKALRAGEPTDAKPTRCIVPRVPLAQKLLSKLPKSFDGGGSTHIYINLITSLNARTNLATGALLSVSKRARPDPLNEAGASCAEAAKPRRRQQPRRSTLP